jgi:hypothetical protein
VSAEGRGLQRACAGVIGLGRRQQGERRHHCTTMYDSPPSVLLAVPRCQRWQWRWTATTLVAGSVVEQAAEEHRRRGRESSVWVNQRQRSSHRRWVTTITIMSGSQCTSPDGNRDGDDTLCDNTQRRSTKAAECTCYVNSTTTPPVTINADTSRTSSSSVARAVCGVWCVVFGVWCVVFGVWCGVWCVVCGVWCLVCSVWRVVFGVWCVVCGVWRVACGVWCVACGVWCVVVCGVWCVVFGVWRVACGVWRVVFGVWWCVVCGVWCGVWCGVVCGVWCVVHVCG